MEDMKHIYLSFLLTMLISFFGTKAFAYDIEVKNADGVSIYYEWINNDTELSVVSGPANYKGNVVIPNSVEYNDKVYNVTCIGSNTFYYCRDLISITIGNNVKKIGRFTFARCNGLTSIMIPNNVTSIEDYAFYECHGLTTVTIGSGITTINEGTFSQCINLTSVTIGNSVAVIGTAAFLNCKKLTSVHIPNSVTSIDNLCFGDCSGLTSITVQDGNPVFDSREGCNAIIRKSDNTLLVGCKNTIIPNSVTSIGTFAFNGCKGLTSVTIPNSVTSIENIAFSGCSGLTSITVQDGNSVFDSREGCNAIIRKSDNTLEVGCKNTIIPNSVMSIGAYAFYECSGLTSITIPNSVTSIGAYAFNGCKGLTSVTIPNSVTSIEVSVFDGCEGLTSVTIPNSVTSIGDWAFYDCKGLTSVMIPNSVMSIGASAFAYCRGLTSITIPNSVTSIGSGAFSICSGLTSITVQDDNSVFDSREDCNAIIRKSDNTLLVGCKNTIIPNSIKSLGDYAFSGSSGLTSITIPNSVTSIGDWAFQSCGGLKDVYCRADIVPTTSSYAFIATPINAILHVPETSIDDYKATAPWNGFKEILAFIMGDANNDGKVNAADIVEVINAKNGHQSASFIMNNADMDGNGTITEADITEIVNIIMGK